MATEIRSQNTVDYVSFPLASTKCFVTYFCFLEILNISFCYKMCDDINILFFIDKSNMNESAIIKCIGEVIMI